MRRKHHTSMFGKYLKRKHHKKRKKFHSYEGELQELDKKRKEREIRLCPGVSIPRDHIPLAGLFNCRHLRPVDCPLSRCAVSSLDDPLINLPFIFILSLVLPGLDKREVDIGESLSRNFLKLLEPLPKVVSLDNAKGVQGQVLGFSSLKGLLPYFMPFDLSLHLNLEAYPIKGISYDLPHCVLNGHLEVIFDPDVPVPLGLQLLPGQVNVPLRVLQKGT